MKFMVALSLLSAVDVGVLACPYLQRRIQQQQKSKENDNCDEVEEDDDEHILPIITATSLPNPHKDHRRRRISFWADDDDESTCGSSFCYGRLISLEAIPAFNLPFAELVEIGSPNPDSSLFNYMEDSQARSNVLEGFPLNNEGPSGAAGYTYVGQFLSHDMNLDETSVLGNQVDPATLPNTNTPTIDLDTLYDFEGATSPIDEDDGCKFVVQGRDFARDESTGEALIPDGRNDEHRIVSQLAVAFMTLHNKFCDELPGGSKNMFLKAQRETVRTWQSVILTDLLPNLLDPTVLAEIASGDTNRVLYTNDMAEDGIMPVEFSSAAFRLFHSRARGRYRMNALTDGSSSEFPRARLFDVGNDDEPILLGGTPLPDPLLVIEWDRFFFEIPDEDSVPSGANVARIQDMLYSRPMMRLPIGEDGTPEEVVEVLCDEPECVDTCGDGGDSCLVVDDITVRDEPTASLAILDLIRGQTHSVPGGIALATYVKDTLGVADITVYSITQMQNDNVFGLPVGYSGADVPLLLYLAHESIFEHGGRLFGKLGSRIVSEVIYGLVQEAKWSILNENDGTLDYKSPITGTDSVSMEDVLTEIGWM